MKKRIFSLVVALAMLATSFSTTIHAADDEKNVQALNPQYTYENNGYTLEKVSHADVKAGETDGFVDYYQYTDPDRKICTGVVEHIYKDGTDTPERDTAAELAKLEIKLRGKYPTATDEQISSMLAEIEASLTGDACQSYAFSALGYGDWVYIGTMYGGTGITKHNAETMLKSIGLLKDETTGTDEEKEAAKEYNQKMIDSVVGLLYGDNYYTEHPVPTQGILLKINVKTGESEIIMAGSVNGYQVTLRNAVEYNGRFYFIGTQVGTENVADAATGIPSIFEVNPETDEFRTVYQAVTMDEYRAMQQAHVFPIPRAIAVYKGSLIASVTQMDGAHIIAYTPDADDFNADGSFKGIKAEGNALRNPEFTEIAEQSKELLNYPAYHMYDANYGGTVYQMIEYNGNLYMAINAGQKALHSTLNPTDGEYTAVDPDTLKETKCFAGYAILEGTLRDGASPSDRDAWTWTPIIGNTADDQWDDSVNDAVENPAMYTFNIDPNRFAAAICTMEVYNGYLYIGDYNDVTQATYPMLQMDFIHLATVLSQSINLYRMDGNHNIELVVGDATKTFPNGSLSGLESGWSGINGHGSRINQYTSMTQLWKPDDSVEGDGIMLVGTLDEGSLLRPLIKITNGDVLKMDKEEWNEKINYLKVIIQLLLNTTSITGSNLPVYGSDNTADDVLPDDVLPDYTALTPEEMVEQALKAAQEYDGLYDTQNASLYDLRNGSRESSVVLTREQTLSLVEGIKSGEIIPHSMPAQTAMETLGVTYSMGQLTDLLDGSGLDNIEEFKDLYLDILDYYLELLKKLDLPLPEPLKKIFDQLLSKMSAEQLDALATCLISISTSVIGCDTYAFSTDADGRNVKVDVITLNGLGDDSNQTMRNFALTDDYVVFIPGNAIRGGSVYRLTEWPGMSDNDKPDPNPKSYTVTIKDAGEGATGEGEYTQGSTVELYAGTKEGFVFNGWTSDDVTINNSDSAKASFVMISGAVTVTANWKEDSQTPDPDPKPEYYYVNIENAGDGATVSGNYEKNTTVSIYAGTKEGYTFTGWTSSDVVIKNADSARASFVMPEKNVTVTANWNKDADDDGLFTLISILKFDSNGGSKIDDVVGSLGLAVDLTLGKYQTVKEGYTFTGWYADKELTDKVTSVRLGSYSTVYAGWEEIKLPEEKPDIKDIFNDVPSGSYYEDAVIWAVGNGITNGTGEMTFDPDGICTRAQAVTFLWRAAGSPAAEGNVMPFEDVVPGSYYYDAVLWAVEKGITKGTSETTFSPDMNCSRAQIVTFLWRSQGSPAADGIILFDDVASDVYYTEAVLWAVSESVTNGTSATTFSPDNNCTRAQIVTFIWRTLAD